MRHVAFGIGVLSTIVMIFGPTPMLDSMFIASNLWYAVSLILLKLENQ